MVEYVVAEVFTNKSKDLILETGGSASWVLAEKTAKILDYCVCCRNPDRSRDDDSGDRPERRNEAFLVGKVSGVEFVERLNDRNRYLIKFSEYAEVSIPDFRSGSLRNPVVFGSRESCRIRGLDIDALKFKPMPEPTKRYTGHGLKAIEIGSNISEAGLSVEQAKDGLAARYKVPVSAIQIIITM
jgi:hypothetical protein